MQTTFEPHTTIPDAPAATAGCAKYLVFAFAMLWIAVLAFLRQGIALFASATPGPMTDGWGLPLTAGLALLLAIPVVPLALFWREPRYKSIFTTWALATLFMVFLLPVQIPDVASEQLRAVLHLVLSVIYAAVIAFLGRRRLPAVADGGESGDQQPRPFQAPGALLAGSLFAGALLAYPWLAWGALGSPLDTLLQFLAAFAFGLSAGLLLDRFLLRPFLADYRRQGSPLGRRDRLLLALAASITLLIMAAGTGFPFGGMQLFLMLVLPAAGWLVPELRSTSALIVLVALAAAGPMLWIDADELALVIGAAPGEILQWGFQAAAVAMLLALALGVLTILVPILSRYESQPPRLPAWLPGLLAAAAWIFGGLLYVSTGRPGFFGESLFVILDTQADLSQAASLPAVDERREAVYRTLVEHARTSQQDLAASLARLGIDYTSYYLENALEVHTEPALSAWLASQPGVDRVLPNPRMRPLPEPLPIARGDQPAPPGVLWNLEQIHADDVWSEFGVTGEGVVVGQSDSGVWGAHPQLSPSYRGEGGSHAYNWLDPWNGTSEPTDHGGHGTHTLGSILGQDTGVAPGAEWIGCVNLARNLGNPARYLDCMQFMLAPYPQGGDPFLDGRPDLGAMVLNNSWGCPDLEGCDPESLLHAVSALRTAGIFVGVSAGNDGPFCGSLRVVPAFYPGAFTTGAIDSSGELAFFSSIGPAPDLSEGEVKPELVAPGVEVLSTYPNDTFATASGTSMAGPHTVGVVALMWSANPDLIGDIDRTEAILEASTQPYQGTLPSCPGASDTPSTAVGFGVLDAYEAVRMALDLPTEPEP